MSAKAPKKVPDTPEVWAKKMEHRAKEFKLLMARGWEKVHFRKKQLIDLIAHLLKERDMLDRIALRQKEGPK